MHLFLNKTTKVKNNSESHTRYRILFAIASNHTFMSLQNRSFLNSFSHIIKGETVKLEDFRNFITPNCCSYLTVNQIHSRNYSVKLRKCQQLSLSHLMYEDTGRTYRGPGIIFTFYFKSFRKFTTEFN